MSGLEIRARRAGAAAREEAGMRLEGVPAPTLPQRDGVPRRRTAALLAGAAAVVLVVAVAVSGMETVRAPKIDAPRPPTTPQEPELDQPVADDGVLPVPDAYEALPAYLEDGRPVFVSHPEPGEVVVLDAADPRPPFGGRQQLVAFCDSSGWFADLRHRQSVQRLGRVERGTRAGRSGRVPERAGR